MARGRSAGQPDGITAQPAAMPHPLRIDLPGIPQHIVQRGNDRQPCFFTDADYLCYRAELMDIAQREGCAVHAYVLMNNHVHLLLTPQRAGAVARTLQALGRRHVRYINVAYRRATTAGPATMPSHSASPNYLALSAAPALRQQRYREMVMATVAGETVSAIRQHLQRQHPYGSERFRRAIEAQLGRTVGPQKIGRPRKPVDDPGESRR